MLYFFSYLFAFSAVIVLHIKTWIYYKIKNPNRSIFFGYITGLIGIYFIMSLVPLSRNSKNKPYYKRMTNLLFLFYSLLCLSFIIGLIMLKLK